MLMLILYEAPDDGKKSLEILRRHFESDTEEVVFRGKDRLKPTEEEEETFVLRVSEWKPQGTQHQGLLVDSGASAHIMTDEGAFRFDETFRPKNHIMQLADGTRTSGSVQKKGDAQIRLFNPGYPTEHPVCGCGSVKRS